MSTGLVGFGAQVCGVGLELQQPHVGPTDLQPGPSGKGMVVRRCGLGLVLGFDVSDCR